MDYESDLALWADEQAGLLREGKVHELDLEHLAEEIEGLSRRDRREIESRFRILLAHLQERWAEVYSRARILAEEETGIAALPHESPWTLEEALK